jgi:hypothetical protein
MSEPYLVCHTCGEPVEPGAPGVAFGRERTSMRGFGNPAEFVAGRGGWFHDGHFPASWVPATNDEADSALRAWRTRPQPPVDPAG